MPEKFGLSPSSGAGSPHRWKIRTFLSLTIFTSALQNARRVPRLIHYFDGEEPPGLFQISGEPDRSPKSYRNPITLAQEWHRMLSDVDCASRAGLARKLGVSRARVTQVLGLLELTPEVVAQLAALGDPLSSPIVTERGLRSLLRLPANEQKRILRGLADTAVAG